MKTKLLKKIRKRFFIKWHEGYWVYVNKKDNAHTGKYKTLKELLTFQVFWEIGIRRDLYEINKDKRVCENARMTGQQRIKQLFS